MVINGLIFGIISTLHCAGMCGPLALAVSGGVQKNRAGFALLYQAGRISVYILIGLLVFSIGYSFSLFRMQQILSLVLGSMMVVFVLWQLLRLPVPAGLTLAWSGLLSRISKMISGGRSGSAFSLGVMNGLLPCGAIYIAALYCAGLGSAGDAVIYMLLFGVGTLPVFIAAWLMLGKNFGNGLKGMRQAYRFLPLLVGILMILRGANLGIPYLSPELGHSAEKIEVKNCCKH